DHAQTTCRGREQTIWTIHRSPVVETTDSAFGELECRWTLRVYQDGVVETSRTIPYSGQRYYSTEDRPNRADKSSIYRLDIEEVLERHATVCIDAGGGDPDKRDDYVAALRERVLTVLWRDDVAANNNGEVDLLADADGGERA